VIHQSVDTAQEHYIYLLEDGLSLWLVTVQQAVAMPTEFMALFKCALRTISSFQSTPFFVFCHSRCLCLYHTTLLQLILKGCSFYGNLVSEI
jgi:hypothetical protein